MSPSPNAGPVSFGRLSGERPEVGGLRREIGGGGEVGGGSQVSGPGALRDLARRLSSGDEELAPHRPRAGGHRLRLTLDRGLSRWSDGAGSAVFELLARTLATDKEFGGLSSRLSGSSEPLAIVLLDRSRHLVEVEEKGRLIGVNRLALSASRLSPEACLVAAGIAHGLREAARLRAGEASDPGKARLRDVQNLLVLMMGILGTEWEPAEAREDFASLLGGEDPLLPEFEEYGVRLKGTLKRKDLTVLDDTVFRDGALFDRLPSREKLRVIFAGTLAWYGMLTLGLLRLPRRWFAKKNPYYETAWWILRAKPGGRRLFKAGLARRGLKRLRSFRLLSAFELIWSSWNPTLAVTCLRPVYRSSGGNRRPFRATMATFTYTALVIHPLWVTLLITGSAWALGQVWPWIFTHTKIASYGNLVLHSIVIGFWIGVGLIVATSKLVRRLHRV